MSHASPACPSSHAHDPSDRHRPRSLQVAEAEQVSLQDCPYALRTEPSRCTRAAHDEQSGPAKCSKHSHPSAVHRPVPPQLEAAPQVASHDMPYHPGAHMEQSSPPHPGAHSQPPSGRHRPLPEQVVFHWQAVPQSSENIPSAHSRQASPPCPALHSHTGPDPSLVHRPSPLQSSVALQK